jgi:tRNA A37 threonylcarbamoyladenosine modification protein TsaB
MKTLTAALIFSIVMIFSFNAQAEQTEKEKTLHEIHAMMRLMDSALYQALEGANLQMFGQMGESGKIDKDLIERGTVMVKDGKAVILKTLAGTEMSTLHKEGGYNEKIMHDLHALGDRMLHVIEEVEKLHSEAFKQFENK